MQILLADDNPAFLQALERFLRTDSRIRQLHLARSGAEALELVDRKNPDLVLLDWSLSGPDVLTVVRDLGGGAKPAEIWILVPQDHPEYERAARAAGAGGCLSRLQFTEKIEPILQKLQRRIGRRSPAEGELLAPTPQESKAGAQAAPTGPAGEAREPELPGERPIGGRPGGGPVLETLEDLERLCRRHLDGLAKIRGELSAPRREPEPEHREALELFIICRLGAERVGLPARQVARVEKTASITVLPPDYFPLIGLAAYAGKALPVLGLQEEPGPSGASPEPALLVILHSGRSLAGLKVDGIEDLIPLAPSAQTPLPRAPAAGPRSALTRVAYHKERFIFLLDVDKIMANLNGA
jgi:DNA-binding NarL/FixJ family response regulator/chemotaxis signal transduction protein